MTRRWRLALTIVVGAAAAGGGIVGAAAVVWNRATARAVRQLDTAPGAPSARFLPAELDTLPAPVARYFRFALTPGQPLVRRARVAQVGTFATAPGAWVPFTAVEHFAVWPPGFVWDARVRMLPVATARVRDSYLGGEGAMFGTLAGLLPFIERRGTPELAASALLRYLAEAAWLPTALLPAAGVRWEPVDDTTARASLTDAGTTVTMDVQFGARGEIVRVAARRHRTVDGRDVLTPWVGHFRDYAPVAGMMVPFSCEVGWMLPEGWFPYFRGRTVRAEFEFTSPADGVAPRDQAAAAS